ncbi:MAG: O-antigen ligase family protein [Anaerolineae bacterium]|nr:O-antigen ligase family protein [Anaerolineae bacterium]
MNLRKALIGLISLAIFSASVVQLSFLADQTAIAVRGFANAAENTNLPFRIPRFGVNADLTQYEGDTLDKQLAWMVDTHVVWIRQLIYWDRIEPVRGEYDWDSLDTVFKALERYPSLSLLPVLVNTPPWARADALSESPSTPPRNPDDFAEFAAQFAHRYGAQISYYQIWDEPNLRAGWGGLEPRPTNYVALLAAAFKAIHDSDPVASVIAAALAPTLETGPENLSDILFLEAMYAAGAKPFMDAVAAKPYGFSDSPLERTVSPDRLNFSRMILLREEMIRQGDGHKALWASAWGWNSLPGDWAEEPSIWRSVISEQQVRFTLDALDRADDEWPWLGGMILNHWQPATAPDDPQWGFAVVNSSGLPTPLWQALRDRRQVTVASNGLYFPVNPFAHYSGVWTFGELGADIGWVNDSQVSFDFQGTQLSLLLRQGDFVAYLYPRVDGQPANAVPRDAAGNPYVVLTSPSLKQETRMVRIADGLDHSQHRLQMVADRGWDRWVVAGFGVGADSPAASFRPWIIVSAAAAIASAVSILSSVPKRLWLILYTAILSILNQLGASGRLIIGVAAALALMLGMLITWGDGYAAFIRREPVPVVLAFATAGLIQLNPGVIVTAVGLLVLFVVIYNEIHLGLVLTVFWSPFFLFPVELYRYAFPLAEVIILLTTAAWILRRLVDWRQPTHKDAVARASGKGLFYALQPLDWIIVIWLALGCLAVTWSANRETALTELRVIFIEPALFYGIFRSCSFKRHQLVMILDAFVIAGLFVAVIGLWQYMNGAAIITAEDGARRLASVYGSPNNVALFLGRCIPFVIAVLIGSEIDRRRRWLYGFMAVPMLGAFLLTQSVGGIFLGLPAALMTIVLLRWRKRSYWILLGFGAVLVAAFLFSLQSPRFARVLDFSEGTNFYRVRAWQSAVNMIRDHPITGLGLDQFLYEFRGHYIMPDAWQEPNLSHPHNIFLDVWIRLGILGIAWLLALQVTFWRAWLKINRVSDAFTSVLLVGMAASMVNLVAHGLVDNSIFVQDLAYVFVLLVATLAYLTNARAIDEAPDVMV